MKLSKKLLFIVLNIWCTNCYSQENKLFLANKGGLNLSIASLKNQTAKTGLKPGVCSGWSFGWGVSKKILILIEGAYDQKGYTNEVMFTDNSGNPVGTGNIKYAFNYFSIPVSVNYTTGKKSSFEGGIGICNSILLNANYSYPDELLIAGMNSIQIGITKYYKKYDPGIFIRAAGNFHINSSLSIFIEARITQGISNAAVSEADHAINSTVFAGAGLRVYFGKSRTADEK